MDATSKFLGLGRGTNLLYIRYAQLKRAWLWVSLIISGRCVHTYRSEICGHVRRYTCIRDSSLGFTKGSYIVVLRFSTSV